MQLNVHDKRVLVTAGASGIGLAIANAFHAGGARVRVCDIDADHLATVAERGIGPHRTDVADPASVAQMFATIDDEWGGLDVLVNNAGIAGPTKLVEDVTADEWTRTVAVNLTGQFLCVKYAAPAMKRQRSGCIIAISSTAGRMGVPMRTPYSATKYAIRGLADTLAMELGEFGIRVNAILPGLIDGPRGKLVVQQQAAARGMDEKTYLPAMIHNISLHAMITGDEIAAMAMFLASDQGRHITGQSIGVCAGFETYRSPLDVQPRDVSFSFV